MSYNTDPRSRDVGPLFVVTAVLSGLVVLTNSFTVKTIFELFEMIKFSDQQGLFFMVGMFSLAELGLMLAFSIVVVARCNNDILGNIMIASAVVTFADVFIRICMAGLDLGADFWVSVVSLLAYDISMAVIIKSGVDVIRTRWFVPAIFQCAAMTYTLIFHPETFRYVMNNLSDINIFMTAFLMPIVTIAFAFCVMKWAAGRTIRAYTDPVKNTSLFGSTQGNPVRSSDNPPVSPYSAAARRNAAQRRPAEKIEHVSCPSCGRIMNKNIGICSNCGANLQAEPKAEEPKPVESIPAMNDPDESVSFVFCHKCGMRVTTDCDFCFKCGAKIIR